MRLDKPTSLHDYQVAHPELTEREAQRAWEKWLSEWQKQERGK